MLAALAHETATGNGSSGSTVTQMWPEAHGRTRKEAVSERVWQMPETAAPSRERESEKRRPRVGEKSEN